MSRLALIGCYLVYLALAVGIWSLGYYTGYDRGWKAAEKALLIQSEKKTLENIERRVRHLGHFYTPKYRVQCVHYSRGEWPIEK